MLAGQLELESQSVLAVQLELESQSVLAVSDNWSVREIVSQ